MQKLYIYDSTDSLDKMQASGRFDGKKNITTMGVISVDDLILNLNGLVLANKKFNKVIVQTHGNSGVIGFGKQRITSDILKSKFSGKNYHKIFSDNAHLHFDGCNVAEGKDGWEFLTNAGKIFLYTGGGTCSAWTNLGAAIPGWMPFIWWAYTTC